MTTPAHRTQKKRGLTLVEVALALGVVSFSMISILGLLPSGLVQLRESMNQTVEAQIVSAIAAQALVTEFSNQAGTEYFDEEGLAVRSTDPNVFYTVEISALDSIFPGSSNKGGADSLRRLQLEIEALNQPGNPILRSIQIANYGK